MKNSECAARQCSDQMYCDKCALVWDMNDPEPPECLKPNKVAMSNKERQAALKKKRKDAGLLRSEWYLTAEEKKMVNGYIEEIRSTTG